MKKIICIFTTVSILASLGVFAKIDDASVVSDSMIQYIGTAEKGKRVSITVLKPGCNMDEFMSNDLMLPLEYSQTVADENGNYSFDIDLSGVSGTYGVYVSDDKGNGFIQDKIMYVNKSANAAALDALRVVGADIAEVLKSSAADLGVDARLIVSAGNAEYKAAADMLSSESSAALYVNNVIASENIDKALAIANINAGKLNLNNTYDLLLMSDNVGKWYTENFMTESLKTYISERLNKESDTFEKFDKSLAEATALGIIYGAKGYGSVTTYLRENADILGIDKNKATDDFSKSVIGMKFDKFSDINIESFKESTPNFGGGGGGGRSPAGGMTIGSIKTDVAPIAGTNTTPGVTFSDMESYGWAIEAVSKLAEKNIILGKAEGMFAPADLVLREEFVKMIMEAGSFEEIYGDITFEDVSADAWFRPYVKKAFLCGIVNGYSDKLFGSGTSITRQDMAVICYNMLKAKGIFDGTETGMAEYDDAAEIADYARLAVGVLTDKGILTGDNNNRFMPGGNATRAEAAQMIYRAYQLIS